MTAAWKMLAVVVASFALGACTVAPAFQTVPSNSAPAVHIVAESSAQWINKPVLWGGMIMEVRNFENHSEIEVLAYPLDARQRPMLEAPDEGRFIALLPGYVESQDFPEGRFLSVIGYLTGDRSGVVREQTYVWPEVDVRELHVWPRDFREPGRRFTFGVGVGIGL